MLSPAGSERISLMIDSGSARAASKLRLQIAELGARRQAAVPQQVAHFLERRVPREIVDVVAAIGEHAAIAVHIADGGRGGDRVFEPCLGRRGHGHDL